MKRASTYIKRFTGRLPRHTKNTNTCEASLGSRNNRVQKFVAGSYIDGANNAMGSM